MLTDSRNRITVWLPRQGEGFPPIFSDPKILLDPIRVEHASAPDYHDHDR